MFYHYQHTSQLVNVLISSKTFTLCISESLPIRKCQDPKPYESKCIKRTNAKEYKKYH